MPARFEDYRSDPEVRDIMERYVKKFPLVFDGFDVDAIGFIVTQKKEPGDKKPIKLHPCRYPAEVFIGKTYIVEVFDKKWSEMNTKQKNLAVFHTMCAIPVGGFDPGSKDYAKKCKPDIVMYRNEFAASGGVPFWMEDDSARDPMEAPKEEIVVKTDKDDEDPIPAKPGKQPVTMKDIADIGEAEAS